jgi:hypothetical protein
VDFFGGGANDEGCDEEIRVPFGIGDKTALAQPPIDGAAHSTLEKRVRGTVTNALPGVDPGIGPEGAEVGFLVVVGSDGE